MDAEKHDAGMLCAGPCKCAVQCLYADLISYLFVNLGGRSGTSPEGVSKTRAPSLTLTRKPMIKGLRCCKYRHALV